MTTQGSARLSSHSVNAPAATLSAALRRDSAAAPAAKPAARRLRGGDGGGDSGNGSWRKSELVDVVVVVVVVDVAVVKVVVAPLDGIGIVIADDAIDAFNNSSCDATCETTTRSTPSQR